MISSAFARAPRPAPARSPRRSRWSSGRGSSAARSSSASLRSSPLGWRSAACRPERPVERRRPAQLPELARGQHVELQLELALAPASPCRRRPWRRTCSPGPAPRPPGPRSIRSICPWTPPPCRAAAAGFSASVEAEAAPRPARARAEGGRGAASSARKASTRPSTRRRAAAVSGALARQALGPELVDQLARPRQPGVEASPGSAGPPPGGSRVERLQHLVGDPAGGERLAPRARSAAGCSSWSTNQR